MHALACLADVWGGRRVVHRARLGLAVAAQNVDIVVHGEHILSVSYAYTLCRLVASTAHPNRSAPTESKRMGSSCGGSLALSSVKLRVCRSQYSDVSMATGGLVLNIILLATKCHPTYLKNPTNKR